MTGPAWISPAGPPDCTLWVDGARFDDGSDGRDGDPVALADVSILWGRTTVLDQPAPASARFAILDVEGGQRFRDRLRVGSQIEIHATATIYPDPSVSVADNPGFETDPVAARTTGGTAVATGTGRPSGGGGTRSLRVDHAAGSPTVTVTLPPRVFTTDPIGWDTIPRTLPGEAWTVGVTVWTPGPTAVGASPVVVYAEAVAFNDPAGTVVTAVGPRQVVTGTGWRAWSTTVTPPAGVWLGVRIVVTPPGVAWKDVPADVSWDELGATPTWLDLGRTWFDDLQLLAPAAGAVREGVVFAGRVTDLSATYDPFVPGTMVQCTAQDPTADMRNRLIGRTEWPLESANARAQRIHAEAARANTTVTVDSTIASRQIQWRPPGRGDAGQLLEDVAQSAGGVLWCISSVAGVTLLRIEDLGNRVPYATLKEDASGVVHVVLDPNAAGWLPVDACSFLLEPVSWVQDTTDVATVLTLSWQDDIGTGGAHDLQQTEITLTDAPGVARYGTFTTTIDTQLANATDALNLATKWHGRLRESGWRVAGLTFNVRDNAPLGPDELDVIMKVLDMTTRVGLPLMVTNLPEWTPVLDTRAAGTVTTLPLYVDGGGFAYTENGWTLELVTVDPRAVGKADVAWNELPATTPAPNTGPWRWDEFAADVSWDDLAGVSV